MDLIKVKFEKSKKLYAFLSELPIKVNTIIQDNRYNTPYKVVEIVHTYTEKYFEGNLLKEIRLSHIEKIIKEENIEKRAIKVSLAEAKEWYNSGNSTLRTLALQVYTKEELAEPKTFEEIYEKIGTRTVCLEVAEVSFYNEELKKECLRDLKLKIIALYFNSLHSKVDNKRYFIAKESPNQGILSLYKLRNYYCIAYHINVVYPGLVYFNRAEDAKKAFEMLKEEFV